MKQPQVELKPVVVVKGAVDADMIDYARGKALAMVDTSVVPVLEIDLRFTRDADPARERPNHFEATVDLDGKPVRAHGSAPTMSEAIDAALKRLRRRVEALSERPQSRQLRHRDHESWHHEDRGRRQVPVRPNPLEGREVVRRKTFALRPESIEGALFDLEVLDHDFFLFVHDETGTEAVVYRAGQGYGLMSRVPAPDAVARVEIPLEAGPPPVMRSTEDALTVLEASGRSFEFFVDAETRRGLVAYRRHDGDYGLILPT
jgi:ribosome-associated translation inhibitor RaiA